MVASDVSRRVTENPHTPERDVAVKTPPEGSRDALWQVGAHFKVETFVLPVCLPVSLPTN